MVESTRWLFVLLAMVSLLLALPVLTEADATMLPLAAGSAVVLILSWGAGFTSRTAPLAMDVVDAVATLGLALASPSPIAVLGFVFGALWFRSLYGSTWRAVLRCGLYVAALTTALPLWAYVPGHVGGTDVRPVLGVFPVMFLTVIVSRHLAGSVRARERAARLDAVHVTLGAQLLGVTDSVEIRRIAWTSVAGICAATPGLRVLKLVRDGALLRVDGATGGFAGIPATLPVTVLSELSVDGASVAETTPHKHAELDATVGIPCAWACVPLPNGHHQHGNAWLVLGSPRRVLAEAVVSIGSLANQVTLALQNSEVHQELTVQATLDNLTGLANRPSFNVALSAALEDEAAQPTTVLFVDLDDFKDVNDKLGHGAGDDLLREIAARLRRATRPNDLCARLGGDEFAVLLRGTDGLVAARVATRIVQSIAAPAQLGPGLASVSASVGVATATSEIDREQLIHRADVAMYAAKANGKGRFQPFEAGLLQGNSPEALFEAQLSAASTRGELVVHYQPVLSLPDLRCTAVEALVRWQHPERGLLYPDSFIDIAERTGAIHDIGADVLRRSCADIATWREDHPHSPLSVHVNVSALQLDDDRFFATVVGCLNEFDLPPEALVLEITETVLIASNAAIQQLNSLAAHGVVIAIDDFGTGYSALTTLRSLPVQIVKIDKSFIAGSTINPEDRAVTEAVVKMATQMGMRTIAEGVERLDQQRFLESIGADLVQGYLYLRPQSSVAFGAWLGTNLAGKRRNGGTSEVVVPFKPRHTA